MRGNEDSMGIIPLSLNEIFSCLNQCGQSLTSNSQFDGNGKAWRVKVSYLEIYNEQVNDLLDSSKKNLDLKESINGNIIISSLSKFEVSSFEETVAFLQQGDMIRAQAETTVNEKSSRSHSVFKIDIEIITRDSETGQDTIKIS